MTKLKSFNTLRRLIELKGMISISTFMEEILYNKDYGYYTKHNIIGQNGDFITAPEISQLFGEMIGAWCIYCWQTMGCPNDFNLVELGPGRGTLMQDLLRSTSHIKDFHKNINLYYIETSEQLSYIQKTRMSNFPSIKTSWHKNIFNLPPKPTIFIANEFFDALPIRQYQRINDYWHEIMITIFPNIEEFCFSQVPTPGPVNQYLEQELPLASNNSFFETSVTALEYTQNIADQIKNYGGCALIIDYGYDYNNMTRIMYQNSLQAVKNHKYHPVLLDIGQADISAKVDFFAIKRTALSRKCKTLGVISQGRFLRNLGIELRADVLLRNAKPEQATKIISGLERLITSEQMGDLFKVLTIYNEEFPSEPPGFS